MMNSFVNSSEPKPDASSSHITKSHLSGGHGSTSQGVREIAAVPLIAGSYELRPVVTFENMKTDMKEAAFEIAEYVVRKLMMLNILLTLRLGLMLKGEKRHFRELAEYVKKEFDTRFPGTWHVIVGKR